MSFSGNCALPDLTRSLRWLGIAPEPLRSAHDRWFMPLLRARPLHVAPAPELAAAWHTQPVQDAWERVFAELGALYGTKSPAHARAMEARLEQCAHRAVLLLRVSHARARDVQHATDLNLLTQAWHEWTECLHQLFRAADDAWGCMAEQLQNASCA